MYQSSGKEEGCERRDEGILSLCFASRVEVSNGAQVEVNDGDEMGRGEMK